MVNMVRFIILYQSQKVETTAISQNVVKESTNLQAVMFGDISEKKKLGD